MTVVFEVEVVSNLLTMCLLYRDPMRITLLVGEVALTGLATNSVRHVVSRSKVGDTKQVRRLTGNLPNRLFDGGAEP